ncbi:cobalt ABC transporter substrate-binding protein CbiN [Nostoc sp. 'Peltigera membranacea cyanobiont' 213]|uniref:energy-coupling factor ABC transporter substrate-binding protein n=1 Tax=unclassified Nostoc TaxID=2593658 RepID=UPI000B95A1FA|nr:MULTISPECIES: energy-coupling factor ABC transporter substrate-binding protein [unclassified Nostoc]AVH64630.1 cobalt transporter CbiN [Nostoc sp. 'Peltigera membranacea cyanobiont' N6]OYD95047.1 cobalt ABC transporter substrate-binding protein CbiN [Nostoc sp. 'Peltigera membranacea cyanobiont' 213]OYE01677.1 cobalt ABC transporter substrate-binding protein CbiN [Nostoc sp. 'Peltigera membranacea cyanobiont' 232]
MSQSKKGLSNWLLVVAVLALAVAPLIFVRGGEFAGSDDKAEKAITEIQPGYKPWFKSFFEPASGEIESLLFASQAALGAGVVGYAIGLYKGRSQQKREE